MTRWIFPVLLLFSAPLAAAEGTSKPPLDPAAWGADHVGKATPPYITGDECLFCHHRDMGPGLQREPHVRTIRLATPDEPAMAALATVEALKPFAAQIKYVLGSRGSNTRYLREGKGMGAIEILTAARFNPDPKSKDPASGGFHGADGAKWDDKKFGEACAGCHATGIETESQAYNALANDCYACHGDTSLNHANDTKVILLAKNREDPPEQVASICAQCHLRGGKSRSTGLPYPNQFVPGDNLFKDFEVDFSPEKIKQMPTGDRHIYENVRAMVIDGKGRTTCLTCHEVHRNSTKVHYGAPKSDLCMTCHPSGAPWKDWIKDEPRKSATCEY